MTAVAGCGSTAVCRCGVELPYRGRGRPQAKCSHCRRAEIAAKQAAYYEEHRAEIAAKQAAYREEHRAEIAAKQAAYYEEHRAEIAAKQRNLKTCSACGERLRHPSASGLCGFCEMEIAA